MDPANTSLDTFLDQLITAKHGDNVDPEARTQMKAELLPQLHRWINLKTMEQLAAISPETLAEFQALVAKNPQPQEVQAYIQGKIPNGAAFLATTLASFHATYLGR